MFFKWLITLLKIKQKKSKIFGHTKKISEKNEKETKKILSTSSWEVSADFLLELIDDKEKIQNQEISILQENNVTATVNINTKWKGLN